MDLEREMSLMLWEDLIKLAAIELHVRKLLDKAVPTAEECELIDELLCVF